MRKSFYCFAVLAICIIPTIGDDLHAEVAVAQLKPDSTSTSDVKSMDDGALAKLLQSYLVDPKTPNCTYESLLSEMQNRERFKADTALLHTIASMECAAEKKDWKKAYRFAQIWEQADEQASLEAVFISVLAYLSGNLDDALDRFEIIAKMERPDFLLRYSDQTISEFVNKVRREGKEGDETRFYKALVQSQHFNLLLPDVKSTAAAHMVGVRLADGDEDGAVALLQHVTTPYLFSELLALRKFEPIWPAIEQRIGPNMKNVIGEYLQIQREAFNSDVDEKRAKQAYAQALKFAGEFEQIVELAKSIDRSSEGIASWEQDDGWLLDLEAEAHEALGNSVAAEKIYDDLFSLYDPNINNGWLVNFAINRALKLIHRGKWAEGLAAAEAASEVTNKTGNDYAKMLIRKAKVCALFGLNRQDDALGILDEVKASKSDSLPVAIQTLLCANEETTAAELLLVGLADEKEQADILEQLQNPLFNPLFVPIILPSVYSTLGSRPEVKREFSKLARFIPEEFIPIGNLRLSKLIDGRFDN